MVIIGDAHVMSLQSDPTDDDDLDEIRDETRAFVSFESEGTIAVIVGAVANNDNDGIGCDVSGCGSNDDWTDSSCCCCGCWCCCCG